MVIDPTSRHRVMSGLCRALLALALLAAAPAGVRANGDPSGGGPPTVFERFVLSACSPCVRESYTVTTLQTAPLTVSGVGRAGTAAATGRPGEIAIEVLRARQPGRADWTSLALRVTLSVMSRPGETYRLGAGLLDATDVGALAQAVADMARLATAPAAEPSPESVDVDFHGGSLRIGVLRVRGDAVAYVQTGDLPTLMQRAVWEVPTTLYLALKDLPALSAALVQAAATIERVRGSN
jgi:hypothetical protein